MSKKVPNIQIVYKSWRDEITVTRYFQIASVLFFLGVLAYTLFLKPPDHYEPPENVRITTDGFGKYRFAGDLNTGVDYKSYQAAVDAAWDTLKRSNEFEQENLREIRREWFYTNRDSVIKMENRVRKSGFKTSADDLPPSDLPPRWTEIRDNLIFECSKDSCIQRGEISGYKDWTWDSRTQQWSRANNFIAGSGSWSITTEAITCPNAGPEKCGDIQGTSSIYLHSPYTGGLR